MSSIYQKIIDVEEWLSISSSDNDANNATADIRIREDVVYPEKLFPYISADIEHKVPSLGKIKSLLYAYNIHEGEKESAVENNKAEMYAFIDSILDTPQMKLAIEYLESEGFTDNIRDFTFTVWFELFTNYYSQPEGYCSGFEHVFVGELQPHARPDDNKMDIGGYHFWYKYWLDQEKGDIKYLGNHYGRKIASAGINCPYESFNSMQWNIGGQWYEKTTGGFFVGCKPEMIFALGIVAMWDHKNGKYAETNGTNRRLKYPNGDDFDLVLYPQTIVENGTRTYGFPHLRSLYPVFIGSSSDAHTPGGDAQPTKPNPNISNNGYVLIYSAVPNPDGDDQGKESITLFNNSTATVSIDNWYIRDRSGGTQAIKGKISRGGFKTIVLPADSAVSLSNSSDDILLYDAKGNLISKVTYSNPRSGKPVFFKS